MDGEMDRRVEKRGTGKRGTQCRRVQCGEPERAFARIRTVRWNIIDTVRWHRSCCLPCSATIAPLRWVLYYDSGIYIQWNIRERCRCTCTYHD